MEEGIEGLETLERLLRVRGGGALVTRSSLPRMMAVKAASTQSIVDAADATIAADNAKIQALEAELSKLDSELAALESPDATIAPPPSPSPRLPHKEEAPRAKCGRSPAFKCCGRPSRCCRRHGVAAKREKLLSDLETIEAEAAERASLAPRAVALGEVGVEGLSGAAVGAAAVLVAARGALVSSKLDRERKEFEEEQRLASPGRRGFVVATATGLAGAALGVSTLLSGREGGIDLTALKQAKPQVVVAKAPLKPSAVERKVSEAQARAEAAESRAAAAGEAP